MSASLATEKCFVVANNGNHSEALTGAKRSAAAYVRFEGPSIVDGKIKGRGALSNRPGRFARQITEHDPDALEALLLEEDAAPRPKTTLHVDHARTIIARNRSPDLPFTQSINPYRGCEHGCIYCYARATHSYLDLSPGLDFETQLFYKPNARELLRAELAARDYVASPIALGTNTDPYQPIERELMITRTILELLLEVRHPTTIVTKGALILRDLDLLAELARLGLVAVSISVTTLDDDLKRRLEPRTAGPVKRLQVIRELVGRRVPTSVLAAPIIPGINDHELERLLEAAAESGATSAGYVLLRLPHEVEPLFTEWLHAHYPERAEHVRSLIRQMRGGVMNDPAFHSRQRGMGPFAALLEQRFRRTQRRLGLDRAPHLSTALFAPPRTTPQLDFFAP
jgi:DNA repair photolyase